MIKIEGDFEVSMIEYQVKELREMAIRQRNNEKVSGKVFFEIENALSQAADTIEALSAKLAEANMERSDRYYGEELKEAKETIRKLLCSEYGSSCQFCIQDNNENAMCRKVGGSGGWCCENAAWNGKSD